MDEIALIVGNFLVKVFKYIDAGLFTEAIEWIGVKEVGYVTSIAIIAILVLVIYTQRKGVR
jgi:hypothetical protein